MQIDATTAIIWAAGVTGFFTAFTAVAVTWITKRSDERRHLRELVLRTAVDNWKEVFQAARDSGDPSATIQPLDVFILHMLKFSEVITAKDLSPENVAKRLREVQTLVEIAQREASEFTERSRKANEG